MNTVLAVAALTALPRLQMRLPPASSDQRCSSPPGLAALKTVGRFYVQRTEANPAYQVVTGAVAVLVFLSLLNQFILFAAALTTTGTGGPVTVSPPAGRSPHHTAPQRPAHLVVSA